MATPMLEYSFFSGPRWKHVFLDVIGCFYGDVQVPAIGMILGLGDDIWLYLCQVSVCSLISMFGECDG